MENNIHNELAEIAPVLAAMEKRNPFKVPDGYFSSLEEKTFQTITQKQGKQDVPDGYFDTLSSRVMEQVAIKPEPKIIPLYRRRWLSIAASLVLLFGAVYFMQSNVSNLDPGEEFAFDFEADEALDYLIENDELYLSDLINFDVYGEGYVEESTDIDIFEDEDLEDFLNELDPEELEDLL